MKHFLLFVATIPGLLVAQPSGANLSGTNTVAQTTVSGNAGTAAALQTARTIEGRGFNASANVTSFPSPGTIGGGTPDSGAFTTLSASGLLTAATARIGPAGFGSIQPLEIVGADGGLAVTSTNTGLATETYWAGFIRNAVGRYQKLGAENFRWVDDDATSGYASWNTHATANTAGVANDYYGAAFAAKHGFVFFPANTSAASFPGDGIVKVNGALVTTGAVTVGGVCTSTLGNDTLIFNSQTATTGYQYAKIKNTAGAVLLGVNGNAGTLVSGSTAYASVITSGTDTPVQIGVNQALVGSFTSTGLAVTGNLSATGPIKLPCFVVSELPAASTAGVGALACVTDANATTRLSTVAGGGVNKVIVFSDGTNWLII